MKVDGANLAVRQNGLSRRQLTRGKLRSPGDASQAEGSTVCRLSIFTFLWASQALVHQEFFSNWFRTGNPLGWILTVCALAALLWPRSLPLFSAMLASSVV